MDGTHNLMNSQNYRGSRIIARKKNNKKPSNFTLILQHDQDLYNDANMKRNYKGRIREY